MFNVSLNMNMKHNNIWQYYLYLTSSKQPVQNPSDWQYPTGWQDPMDWENKMDWQNLTDW